MSRGIQLIDSMPGLLSLPRLPGSVLPHLPLPPPHPPSSPAEAASFVSLIFLPFCFSDSCNETCHLEMAPHLPPEDVTQPQLPLHLFIHSFIQQPLLRACPMPALSQALKTQAHHPAPALKRLPVWQDTKDMGTKTRIKFRFD